MQLSNLTGPGTPLALTVGQAIINATGIAQLLITGHGAGNAITTLTGLAGDILVMHFVDALVNFGSGAADFVGGGRYYPQAGDRIVLWHNGTRFEEVSRASASDRTTVTATVDGLTTGIIPDGVTSVLVVSSVNTKLVTLPNPAPGSKPVRLFCTANGYKLQSSNKATIKINNVADGAKVLAVAAGSLLIAECVSATEWYIWLIDNLGAPATAGIPA